MFFFVHGVVQVGQWCATPLLEVEDRDQRRHRQRGGQDDDQVVEGQRPYGRQPGRQVALE